MKRYFFSFSALLLLLLAQSSQAATQRDETIGALPRFEKRTASLDWGWDIKVREANYLFQVYSSQPAPDGTTEDLSLPMLRVPWRTPSGGIATVSAPVFPGEDPDDVLRRLHRVALRIQAYNYCGC